MLQSVLKEADAKLSSCLTAYSRQTKSTAKLTETCTLDTKVMFLSH